MKIRRIVLLFCTTLVLVSCGSTKRTTVYRKEKTDVTRELALKEKQKEVAIEEEGVFEKTELLPNLSYSEKVQRYIYQYSGIAKNEMSEYGIPASITLAQGILESGTGYGELAINANNHFGIKCHDWEGDRVYHDDDKSQECFRKYNKVGQSYRDHSLFLANRDRYAALFGFNKGDYKRWARGLKDAGYATDRKYPDKLISIIERYQLYRYDKEVLGNVYKKPKDLVVEQVKQPKLPKEIKSPKPPKVISEPKESDEKTTVTDKAKVRTTATIATTTATVVNGKHVVAKGETLYSISRRYKITVQQLKAFNNLKNNNILVGQALKVKEGVKAVEDNIDDEF